ncbi:hypothetical protein [Bacillus sp. FSL K6-0067]|uniref:hypothetical protein n=1 Tax=Bacillus sp. FSL K6-0067 TaxID=2921412 RepID=UPI000779F4B6|nr:hypothetical protein [Bacillus cereus]KXY35315.1 hypothetical protein AT267_20785 [Bacillus cereus]
MSPVEFLKDELECMKSFYEDVKNHRESVESRKGKDNSLYDMLIKRESEYKGKIEQYEKAINILNIEM